MCFTCSCKHWSSHLYQILMKLFSTVHQTLIQTLVFIELLVGAFFLLIQSVRPKSQISFKRVKSGLDWVFGGCFLSSDTNFFTKVTNLIQESLVFVEHLMGTFFCWYKIFHQSYKSHSRESGLYWASGECFLLLIQKFPPKLHYLIQESLVVFIELLVGAFFCWYKVYFPTKVQSSFKLCLCVCFLSLSVSLSGAFSVSFIELSGGLFYFPFLWSLMGIVSLTVSLLIFQVNSSFF